MNNIKAQYAQYGFTPAPHEGFFNFRLRAEHCTDLRLIDQNLLRERLYDMWCHRLNVERVRLRPPEYHKTMEGLLQQVAKQWA